MNNHDILLYDQNTIKGMAELGERLCDCLKDMFSYLFCCNNRKIDDTI